MKIVAYVPLANQIKKSSFLHFIVETFFWKITQKIDHTYIIITDTNPQFSFSKNVEIIVKPIPQNALLKKIWWDVKLPAILKKQKAELFISFDNNCSLAVSVPQIVLVSNLEKIKPSCLKKARSVIVNSESVRNELTDKYDLSGNQLAVIYPSADKNYKEINTEERERVKKEFSEDKEYFLYNGPTISNKDLVDLLKSFSHFKKRQQSSFKLLLLMSSDPTVEKIISDYKYRGDIKFIGSTDKNHQAMITGTAYAVILPNDDLVTALNTMKAGIPVITSKDSIINEVAGDAALYADTKNIKDIGEKMMQLYTNEDHRSLLIKKGIDAAGKFSPEKSGEILWQAIMKALE